MSDNLVIGGATFNNVTGIKATDTGDNTVTYANIGGNYIQTFEYTHATAWTTDSTGNTSTLASTYCNNGNGIYWLGVDQTSTDAYRGVRGFVLRQSDGSVPSAGGSFLRGSSNWSKAVSSSSSFHLVAGAKIKVWYIPLSTALEGLV